MGAYDIASLRQKFPAWTITSHPQMSGFLLATRPGAEEIAERPDQLHDQLSAYERRISP